MDTTLEDKTKELMEESRMLLVQFSIDRVSLGVHSMGNVFVYSAFFITYQSSIQPTKSSLLYSKSVTAIVILVLSLTSFVRHPASIFQ